MTVSRETWSPEWYAERLTYIGASEAAEAVGLSPWGDPIGLWERKRGLAPEKISSFRMTLGDMIEPIIGKLASEALGVKLKRMTGPIRHPDYPFIASNPDFRMIGVRGLVQAKFRLDATEWGEPDDAGVGLGVPLHYRIQGFAEMLSTGLDLVVFAKLDPYSGLRLYPLSRTASDNADAIEDLRSDLVDFWTQYVEPGVMPPPTAGSSDALRRRFPKAEKIGRIASASQEVALLAMLDAQRQAKEAKLVEEATKNVVKAMIGTAAFIEGAGFRFSWSNVGLDEKGEPKRTTVTEWEPVAKAYRSALSELRKDLDEENYEGIYAGIRLVSDELDAIESIYTREEVAEPSRRLTVAKV